MSRIPALKVSKLFQPGFLAGFRIGDLLDLVQAAGWRIDPRYLPRAIVSFAGAAVTTLLKPIDDVSMAVTKGEAKRGAPLFILGLHRSGTTYLQRLLACDLSMCYPSRLDSFHPYSFLTLRRLGVARLLKLVPPKSRHMDGVTAGWLSPEEDAFALLVLGAFGKKLHAVFPKTWQNFSEVECGRAYREALEFFVRKLTLLHGRPVVLKSQVHMSQIPSILQVFPRAKFLAIFRDPVARSESLKAMHDSPGKDWCALQLPPPQDHAKALDHSARLLDRYFADKHLVPHGNLMEIRYEELVANTSMVLTGVYERLALQSGGEGLRAILKCGPLANTQSNKLPSYQSEWLGRILESHHELYERGYYVKPEHCRA